MINIKEKTKSLPNFHSDQVISSLLKPVDHWGTFNISQAVMLKKSSFKPLLGSFYVPLLDIL